uniref:Uncharacterized protein n=1 Tax=Magnetococcus massalia (strain MO-1) TaxID=451514 RepID=A0A1S7LCI5_MAGMO|nr:conserved protein of unknown function [Candidatus Magnetococcus massalia]
MKHLLHQRLNLLERLDCTEQDYKAALSFLSDRDLAKVERLDNISGLSNDEAVELDGILSRVHDYLIRSPRSFAAM